MKAKELTASVFGLALVIGSIFGVTLLDSPPAQVTVQTEAPVVTIEEIGTIEAAEVPAVVTAAPEPEAAAPAPERYTEDSDSDDHEEHDDD